MESQGEHLLVVSENGMGKRTLISEFNAQNRGGKGVFCYKVTDFYHPNDEGGLLWKDPEIGVEWPMPEGMTEADLTLSDKDKVWSGISEYVKNRK